MAGYYISSTNESVTFSVYGLSSGDSVRLYVRYEPDPGSAVVDQTYTATSSTMSLTFTIPSSSTYAANCKVNSSWLGAQYFSTGSSGSGSTRPSDWSWSSGLSSGNIINMRYSEWNNFLSRINEFRAYKGLGNYSFTTAVSGQPMRAIQANQAIDAIGGIPGHGTLPTSVVAGVTVISVSFFNALKNALNAVQ